MADALFTINGDSSDQGYNAALGETLVLRLKTLPVSGVTSVRFQVFSPDSFSNELGILQNPPRASAGAPVLDLVGSTTGQSVSPSAVDGTVLCELPNVDGAAHSWIVRCVVNGGMGRLADGRIGPVSTLIHERMVVIRDSLGNRRIVASETTQYDDDGWAGAVNEAMANLRAALPD